MQIHIRDIDTKDAAVWERLRRDLWPDGAADHAGEIQSFFESTLEEPVAVMVAENPAARSWPSVNFQSAGMSRGWKDSE